MTCESSARARETHRSRLTDRSPRSCGSDGGSGDLTGLSYPNVINGLLVAERIGFRTDQMRPSDNSAGDPYSTDAEECAVPAETCNVASGLCAGTCQLVKQTETDPGAGTPFEWTMFGATVPGIGPDNPTSSTSLTQAQRNKAVTVFYDVRAHAPTAPRALARATCALCSCPHLVPLPTFDSTEQGMRRHHPSSWRPGRERWAQFLDGRCARSAVAVSRATAAWALSTAALAVAAAAVAAPALALPTAALAVAALAVAAAALASAADASAALAAPALAAPALALPTAALAVAALAVAASADASAAGAAPAVASLLQGLCPAQLHRRHNTLLQSGQNGARLFQCRWLSESEQHPVSEHRRHEQERDHRRGRQQRDRVLPCKHRREHNQRRRLCQHQPGLAEHQRSRREFREAAFHILPHWH